MRSPLLLLFAVFHLFVSSGCGGKKNVVMWDMEVKGTNQGVLVELTGATILFTDLTMDRHETRKIKIHDAEAARNPSGMQIAIEGWSSSPKAGTPEMGVRYSTSPEECLIRLENHQVIIQNKGEKISIDETQFGIHPRERPHYFVVSVENGKRVVVRESQVAHKSGKPGAGSN